MKYIGKACADDHEKVELNFQAVSKERHSHRGVFNSPLSFKRNCDHLELMAIYDQEINPFFQNKR